MALYLGGNKVRMNLGGESYRLNLFSNIYTENENILLSSDDYILRDSEGVYLIPKNVASTISENLLLSSDDYIL